MSHTTVSIAAVVLALAPAIAQAQARPRARPSGRESTAGSHSTRERSRSSQAALELQVRLDRAGFSPGEIDGAGGVNTTRASHAFARAHHVKAGDASVLAALRDGDRADVLTAYTITPADAAGPFVPEIPADVTAQAELPALSYTSILELVGERVHASPDLLKRLNPAASFTEGETIQVPNVIQTDDADTGETTPAVTRAHPAVARIVVSRAGSSLTAYDASGRVVHFAPVTSGSTHDPLPIGHWTVTAVVHNPTFNYNPALFWDADPADAKVKLPAGPNGPVGTVWIDLSKPHYGIHGTAEPSQIGHTTSHGCVRLTNWDAEAIAAIVRKGTPVLFEP